jgi:hypothetical protein
MNGSLQRSVKHGRFEVIVRLKKRRVYFARLRVRAAQCLCPAITSPILLYHATIAANITVSIQMAVHQQAPSMRPKRSIQLGSGLQRPVSFIAPQAVGNTQQH